MPQRDPNYPHFPAVFYIFITNISIYYKTNSLKNYPITYSTHIFVNIGSLYLL